MKKLYSLIKDYRKFRKEGIHPPLRALDYALKLSGNKKKNLTEKPKEISKFEKAKQKGEEVKREKRYRENLEFVKHPYCGYSYSVHENREEILEYCIHEQPKKGYQAYNAILQGLKWITKGDFGLTTKMDIMGLLDPPEKFRAENFIKGLSILEEIALGSNIQSIQKDMRNLCKLIIKKRIMQGDDEGIPVVEFLKKRYDIL